MNKATLYQSTLTGSVKFTPLAENIDCQTCVIGAGFAGLTTARELAGQGHDVVLIEGREIGWGASGRNAGFVAGGFARSLPSIAAKVGWDKAVELYNLSVGGRDYVRRTISELNLNNVLLGEGWLSLQRHSNNTGLREMQRLMLARTGAELQFIAKPQLSQFIHSDKYQCGLLDHEAFHIHPLNYVHALAGDIVRRGGRIFEKTRCVAVSNNDKMDGWRLECGEYHVNAQNVVLATSAYGGPCKKLNRSMIPVETYIVSGSNCSEELEELIAFAGCISDTRRSGDYYRMVKIGAKNRLVWGGRITTFRSQPARLATMLKKDIVSVFPQLRDIQIEYSWSGLMGYTLAKMPIITQLSPHLWAATAFGGQGVNTCAMAGQLVSTAIAGGDVRYKLFDPFSSGPGGGLIGQIATQLEYWRLQLLDKWDERISVTASKHGSISQKTEKDSQS